MASGRPLDPGGSRRPFQKGRLRAALPFQRFARLGAAPRINFRSLDRKRICQDDHWILGEAAGHFKKGGCVLLYRSKDLRVWVPLHELTSGHWTEKESVRTTTGSWGKPQAISKREAACCSTVPKICAFGCRSTN